ncbi:Transposase [Neobacillus vireti LMG 21834]|uniref:Transposase n=2 Tax=Neobacillus TaxID=2675232 RepID=A0AB94IGM5_9BACI|nr:Transposase [Neobacillus vireti LMG 21834]KLT15981.1 hypothetical protein AA980_22635 [Neobacillus vireti]
MNTKKLILEKILYCEEWLKKLMNQNKMEKVIVGMEPTGHYWLNLAHFLKEQNIKFVVVNPIGSRSLKFQLVILDQILS